MENLVKSIKEVMYDRVTSPLFGSFIVSWSIWNYKTIYILLSTKKVEDKFSYIENILYSDVWSLLSCGLLYPLFTSLIFIFAFPYPEKFIYKFWHARQKELKEAKQTIDDETPLTKEESRKIKRNAFNLEIEYDKSIAKKDIEIKNLREMIENHDLIPKAVNTGTFGLSSDTNKLNDDEEVLDDDSKQIIKILSENKGSMTIGEIINEVEFDKLSTEFLIENMAGPYLDTNTNEIDNSENIVKLRRQGKKVARDEGYIS
jgi:hypothetical protein